MSVFITCRDDHYIDVLEEDGKIVIAHRHFDEKNKADSDDLFFSKEAAQALLTYLKHILGAKFELSVSEGNNASVKVEECKDGEIGLFPSEKKWIGLGREEARILVEKLEKVVE